MVQEFKVGSKVKIVNAATCTELGIPSSVAKTVVENEDVFTIQDITFYDEPTVIKGSAVFLEDRVKYNWPVAALTLTSQKNQEEAPSKTILKAAEIAPMLWESYKNILNEEALTALREVIEDTEKHKEIDFEDNRSVFSAFSWCKTKQGGRFWDEVCLGKHTKEGAVLERVVEEQKYEQDVVEEYSEPIKSNGGSSDYYKLTVTCASDGKKFECEVGDIIQAMVGDNFSLGNIVKATRRMWCDAQGKGKAGTDMTYDRNKIVYFAEDFVNRYRKK